MRTTQLARPSLHRMCRFVHAAIAFASIVTIARQANAQTSTWSLAGNGNWHSASNWSPAGVPNSASADAIINNNPALNVVVSLNAAAIVNSVRVDLGDQLLINSRLVVGGATLNGNLTLGSRAEFGIAGSIANAGTINLSPGSASGDTYVDVLPAGATLSGGGSITVVNGSAISGLTPGGTLTLANQTIQGRGSFGGNTIGIVNQAAGLIRANVAGQVLLVDPSTLGLSNTGTMSAINGGVLQLSGSGGGALNNTGGTIRAEAGSEVQLIGIDLTSGTVQSVGTGIVRTGSSSDSFAANTTFNGNIILGSRGDLGITGTITNTGNILFTAGNATADTYLDVQTAGATLTGGGSITMVAASSLWGTTPGGTLTIVNQTIEGRGSIGRDSISIVNQAGNTIRGNVNGATLALDPNAGGMTNAGIVEAINGGIVTLTGNGGGTYNNAGGMIRAGDGSEVQLGAAAEIIGGTLQSVGTGVFRTLSSTNSIFDGVTFNGYLTTNSRGDLTLRNTITNTGTLQINAGNATSDTYLEIEAVGATLTGGGSIFMNSNGGSRISGELNSTLTLANQTIRGGGAVGSGQIAINNQAGGIFHADTAGGVLVVDVVATPGAFANTGLLQASNGGTLRFSDGFTNEGTIHAGASSLVDVNALFTNGTGGTIRGSGTFEVSSILTNNGHIAPGTLASNSTGALSINLASSGTLNFGASSVLDIDLAGTSAFDALLINGRAALGGQLSVKLLNGYLPSAATSFTILTATNPSTGTPPTPAIGTFANAVNGATIRSADNRATFTVSYISNNQVRLSNFSIVGDFDLDGDLDATDIDQLLRATSGSVPPALPKFDVNFDSTVAPTLSAANSDSLHWVTYLKGTYVGDADLNGAVNFDDLLTLARNYNNTSNALGWSAGNFDGIAGVAFDDLLSFARNYGKGTPNVPVATFSAEFAADWALANSLVPEPAFFATLPAIATLTRRRRPSRTIA